MDAGEAQKISDDHERLFALMRRVRQQISREDYLELIELMASQSELVAELAQELARERETAT